MGTEATPWLLQLLQSLQSIPVVSALRSSDVAFSVLEALHVVGVGAVAGTIVLVDLLLIEAWPGARALVPLRPAIVRVTWWGFALMAVTGLPLAASEAPQLYGNDAFRIKLLLLALLGANQWALHRLERGRAARPAASLHSFQLAAACLSLAGWTGVVIAGRAIAYLKS